MKNYNEFCKTKGCEEYIEWEWDTEFGPYLCTSCQKIGQSYDIEEYPEDCLYLDEIRKIEVEA